MTEHREEETVNQLFTEFRLTQSVHCFSGERLHLDCDRSFMNPALRQIPGIICVIQHLVCTFDWHRPASDCVKYPEIYSKQQLIKE